MENKAERLRRPHISEHWATLRFVCALVGVVLLETAGEEEPSAEALAWVLQYLP